MFERCSVMARNDYKLFMPAITSKSLFNGSWHLADLSDGE